MIMKLLLPKVLNHLRQRLHDGQNTWYDALVLLLLLPRCRASFVRSFFFPQSTSSESQPAQPYTAAEDEQVIGGFHCTVPFCLRSPKRAKQRVVVFY